MNNFFRSSKNPVFFIAEIGGNHEGDFEYAKKLTNLAIESGADAVKFQFYTGDTLVNKIEAPDRNKHFKKFELSDDQNLKLIEIVNKFKKVIPMASIWNEKMLKIFDPYLSIHKVGSGDLTCYPMLSAIANTNKPIILSTGLSSLKEVSDAVTFISKCNPTYIEDKKLALLQCTSSYPTPDEDVNLNAMITLKKEFGLPVGYSDHTLGSEAIEIAVSLGAEIIEKHFTDTRDNKIFRDHKVSLTYNEVKEVLLKFAKIKNLLGSYDKKLTNSEKMSNHQISFRRSVYSNCKIMKGEKLTLNNLEVLRPNHGISASEFYKLLGKKAFKDIRANSPILEEDFKAK